MIAVGAWTVVDKLSLESLVGTNLYISAGKIITYACYHFSATCQEILCAPQ